MDAPAREQTLDERRAALVGKLSDTMDPDGAAEMVLQFEKHVVRELAALFSHRVGEMRLQAEPSGGYWTALNDVLDILQHPTRVRIG